ncbi:hypothetical protein HDU96_002999 [Phlyctochytrium bullatum]|nr:hypothetical protein HDU96_002999 [Phlyctochytrium bullatum]
MQKKGSRKPAAKKSALPSAVVGAAASPDVRIGAAAGTRRSTRAAAAAAKTLAAAAAARSESPEPMRAGGIRTATTLVRTRSVSSWTVTTASPPPEDDTAAPIAAARRRRSRGGYPGFSPAVSAASAASSAFDHGAIPMTPLSIASSGGYGDAYDDMGYHPHHRASLPTSGLAHDALTPLAAASSAAAKVASEGSEFFEASAGVVCLPAAVDFAACMSPTTATTPTAVATGLPFRFGGGGMSCIPPSAMVAAAPGVWTGAIGGTADPAETASRLAGAVSAVACVVPAYARVSTTVPGGGGDEEHGGGGGMMMMMMMPASVLPPQGFGTPTFVQAPPGVGVGGGGRRTKQQQPQSATTGRIRKAHSDLGVASYPPYVVAKQHHA